MSDTKLKPCPCCASDKVRETYITFVPALMCCECGLSISVPMDFKGKYKTELARKWNTRKPIDRIVAELEQSTNNLTYHDSKFGRMTLDIPMVQLETCKEIIRKGGAE